MTSEEAAFWDYWKEEWAGIECDKDGVGHWKTEGYSEDELGKCCYLAGHASRDAEVAELKRRLVECLPILQDYARKNPHHDYQGRTQDPNGVHALLAVIESKGETNEPST